MKHERTVSEQQFRRESVSKTVVPAISRKCQVHECEYQCTARSVGNSRTPNSEMKVSENVATNTMEAQIRYPRLVRPRRQARRSRVPTISKQRTRLTVVATVHGQIACCARIPEGRPAKVSRRQERRCALYRKLAAEQTSTLKHSLINFSASRTMGTMVFLTVTTKQMRKSVHVALDSRRRAVWATINNQFTVEAVRRGLKHVANVQACSGRATEKRAAWRSARGESLLTHSSASSVRKQDNLRAERSGLRAKCPAPNSRGEA